MTQSFCLIPIMLDMHGTPMAYAVAAAGIDICQGLQDLLPYQNWETTSMPYAPKDEALRGATLGMTGIVHGREQCMALQDFRRMHQEAASNA